MKIQPKEIVSFKGGFSISPSRVYSAKPAEGREKTHVMVKINETVSALVSRRKVKVLPVSASVLATAALLQNCLHFSVQLSAEDAREAVKLYSEKGEFPYNEIPENIGEIFDAILAACGHTVYPGNNPNNGGHSHVMISVGNEYSFCIRVRVIAAYTVSVDKKVMPSNLESVGEKFNASENTVTAEPDGTLNARFWWD